MIEIHPVTTEEKRVGERRADWHTPADCFKLLDVQQRLDDGSGRMTRIEESIAEVRSTMMETHARFEAKLDANSRATDAAATATAEILEIISTAKGFFKGMNYLGLAVKWVTGVSAAVLGLYFTWKSGKNL